MKYQVYVGSYRKEEQGEGICLLELDTEKKTLKKIHSYPEMSDNPSFLAINEQFLYAVSERDDCGWITAFARDEETGELRFLNRIRTEGAAMCHLALWPDGRHLSAANYASGSLLVCRLNEDGSLAEVCDFVQHEGKGARPDRQEGPHVHSTCVSRDGTRLYAADLGLDRIFCYRIGHNGKLCPAEHEAQIIFPAGEGPRHFVFTKDEKRLFVLTELGSRLFVFRTADGGKTYEKMYDIPVLPEDFHGENLAADIHLSADEKFLYASNRGKDCITVFSLKPGDEPAKAVEYHTSYGKEPRNFCILPDDQFILIADQEGGKVVLCGRDTQTGKIGEKLCETDIFQASFVHAVSKKTR